MIESRCESHVSHISRESADGKKAKQALNWIKELEGERLSPDGGYPGTVLRMQYHSTAAVPDFFFSRQVKG